MILTNDKIIHKSGENFDNIEFRRLLEYQNILTHAYTLRNAKINFGPNLSFDECSKNYQNLCNELNLDTQKVVRPYQKHTGKVTVISERKTNKLEYNPTYLNDTD